MHYLFSNFRSNLFTPAVFLIWKLGNKRTTKPSSLPEINEKKDVFKSDSITKESIRIAVFLRSK